MAYSCEFSSLLRILGGVSPEKIETLQFGRRETISGFLSVGLKIHCVRIPEPIAEFIQELGGAEAVLHRNAYHKNDAPWCLVLPPVGSAHIAIKLLECIEEKVRVPLFNNKDVQLQVCSPGRLDNRRSALLAIGFYLGSDSLRRYAFSDLETTFSESTDQPRGRRLVIYDAVYGVFDPHFKWATKRKAQGFGKTLPFSDRSDILAGSASRLDIHNINLLATLLVHSQYERCTGYWKRWGRKFEQDMEALLGRHQLLGLLAAPWVLRERDSASTRDDLFFLALDELVAYAFDERDRLVQNSGRTKDGIFAEMKQLLQMYRYKMEEEQR